LEVPHCHHHYHRQTLSDPSPHTRHQRSWPVDTRVVNRAQREVPTHCHCKLSAFSASHRP
jgi:hypothetical protein